MAVSEQTRMAVLGGLSITPMTGYALREQIRDTLGHFWAESFGQIYPALAALEHEGLIERQSAARAGSSTFAITPAGSIRLRELLAETPQPAQPRNGLLLRLFFGRQLGEAACRALVQDARARAETDLARMRRLRADLQGDTGPDAPFILLTVLAGEHSARASIAWAEEATRLLDGLAAAPAAAVPAVAVPAAAAEPEPS